MNPKSQETRQAVLESAIRAFARHGYASTSVDMILQATRLSKPTLYYYFESKAGLFKAILAFAYDETFRVMSEAAGRARKSEEKLVNVAEALFVFAGSHEDLMRLLLGTLFAAASELPPRCVDLDKRRRNFELVRKLVEEAQQSGEFKATYSSTEIAQLIFGAWSHQIRSHLIDSSEPLDRERAERIVALSLEGARGKS